MEKVIQERGRQVDLVDLGKGKLTQDLQSYDLVVIGSGIQAGRWTKEPLELIKKNLESLSKTRVALFVLSGYAIDPANHDMVQSEYLDNVVGEIPGFMPVATTFFAGVFDLKKYNFAVRRLVKSLLKQQVGPDEEVPERIDSRDWDKIREWTAGLLV